MKTLQRHAAAQLPDAQQWERSDTDAPPRAGIAAWREQKASLNLLAARPCLEGLVCCSSELREHYKD